MKFAHPLSFVTPEEVSQYVVRYKLVPSNDLNVLELVAKAVNMMDPNYESKEIFRIVLQMHILDVPEEKVDSDTSRLSVLLTALEPLSSELEEPWRKHKDTQMSQTELATAAINNLVAIWNKYPDKFAEI